MKALTWMRLMQIAEMARVRVGPERKKERGYQWACYCRVCCELRRVTA